jgi:hypothetical protein
VLYFKYNGSHQFVKKTDTKGKGKERTPAVFFIKKFIMTWRKKEMKIGKQGIRV